MYLCGGECRNDAQLCLECHEKALDVLREALKVAHHELTCVHGLWAIDREEADHFRLDTLKALAVIEKVLGDE